MIACAVRQVKQTVSWCCDSDDGRSFYFDGEPQSVTHDTCRSRQWPVAIGGPCHAEALSVCAASDRLAAGTGRQGTQDVDVGTARNRSRRSVQHEEQIDRHVTSTEIRRAEA